MAALKMLLALAILVAIPMTAHAATAGVGTIARDWAPGVMAFAALCLRIRFFASRRRRPQ
jgi:hypothetical protein